MHIRIFAVESSRIPVHFCRHALRFEDPKLGYHVTDSVSSQGAVTARWYKPLLRTCELDSQTLTGSRLASQ